MFCITRTAVFVILFVLLLSASTVRAQEIFTAPGWKHLSSKMGDLEAPNAGNQQTSSIVLDMDGDGVNDFVITERTAAPSVVGYLREASGWTRFVIDPEALRIEAGSFAYDIDNDGDTDILAGGDSRSNEVWWWENPAPEVSSTWQRHLIKSSGASKHHDQIIADFNNDGRDELVFWNQGARTLFLAEIPDNVKTAGEWERTAVYTYGPDEMVQRGSYPPFKRPNEHEGLAAADIDGDGTLDIVGGGRWFKHLEGDTYLPHIIDASYPFTRSMVAQFIAGGRPEVVLVAGDGTAPMVLYEYQDGTWQSRVIVDEVVDGHSVTVADFNGDGHPDIFNAEMGLGNDPNPEAYLLLGDGNGGFTKQIIQQGVGLHESRLVDLDGNGSLDVLGKPYTWDAPRLDIWLNEGIDR